jgi:hypothetical protein
LDVKKAIDQLYQGKREYFGAYINSNQYRADDVRSVLRNCLFDEFDKIEKTLNFVKFNDQARKSEVLSIFTNVKKEKTIIVPKISPRFKSDYSEVKSNPNKGINIRVIATVATIIIVILAIVIGLNFLVFHIDPFKVISGESNTCSNDFNNSDCKLPGCCLKYSNDKLAQLFIPTDAMDTTTTTEIQQNSDMIYCSTLMYQNTIFNLQENMPYHIIIQNLNSSVTRVPKLEITVKDTSITDKNIVISKYNTATNKWNIPESQPQKGSSATIDLRNNIDGIFGLFIETGNKTL